MASGNKKWHLLRLPVSSIRSRLIVFLLLLMLPVLTGIYWYVNQENQRYTDETINSYLEIGADVFDFSRTEHINTLLTISSALTRDWGFRNAFGAGDRATIVDAAENLLMRSFEAADMMMITSMDGQVIADTADQGFLRLSGHWESLMLEAAGSEDGVAEAVLTIDDRPYQITVIPLFLPTPVAWIFAGFPLDQNFVRSIKNSTASDVSVLQYLSEGGLSSAANGRVIASTLGGNDASRMLGLLDPLEFSQTQRLRLTDADYGTLVRPLAVHEESGEMIVAVIQRSYQENQANLDRLSQRLLDFSALVVTLSLLAVIWLARTFTQPVRQLAKRVALIQQGDYSVSAALSRRRSNDELKQLDDSVTTMATGLAEREKMRDLLGKVVSPEIASELMGKTIELGGEERIVTVLFADIRGFTTLSETRSPTQTLALLNFCFEHLCNAIEESGGVVDKFMGDAVMALFGAPLAHDNDAERASKAVDRILSAMDRLKQDERLADAGLSLGIGVHTGLVVAGNMGSSNRLNYTVIGDAVNLASRLESLTRYYGVNCVVSREFVAALKPEQADRFIEIDMVRVKGKREYTRIFTLRQSASAVGTDAEQELARFALLLQAYRSGQWTQAADILHALSADASGVLPDRLYRLYQTRVADMSQRATDTWDGVSEFTEK